MARPPGTGKKKIDIRKIENKLHLKTAFTKRRKGLFKKVEEYCASSGIDAAVFTFSPYGRAYAFGSPSPIQVIDRFYAQDNVHVSSSEDIEEVIEECDSGFWWLKAPMDVESCEIHKFRDSLREFKKNLIERMEDMRRRTQAEINLFV
ncbi:K-box region and MADS-box transcription factor family protein [Euphorbia peplus]|nr:K-box region and MADS-box transcription factor family protein [Euphorbia peplus]